MTKFGKKWSWVPEVGRKKYNLFNRFEYLSDKIEGKFPLVLQSYTLLLHYLFSEKLITSITRLILTKIPPEIFWEQRYMLTENNAESAVYLTVVCSYLTVGNNTVT